MNILRLQRRASDVLVIYQHGTDLRVIRSGKVLKVSHGLCTACRATFGEKETYPAWEKEA